MKIKIDALDRLFSKYIRLRAGGVCEKCGQTKTLQCSHFHGRRKRSVRWNEDNAVALCFSCHMYLGENPLEHYEWFKKRLGEERFELLNIQANMIYKPDINAITLYLKQKIKEVNDGLAMSLL